MASPYTLLEQATKVHTPAEMLANDLDNPRVWTRPTVTDHVWTVVHFGGGPNHAGWPIEEPESSWWQRVLIQLGRVRYVLRSWERYHTVIRSMSAIAYSTWVDPIFGRIGRLRGHRYNGGQWGSVNQKSHAVVFVSGLGQHVYRRGWRSLGMIWFATGGVPVVGHRFFNDHPEAKSKTSCPGDILSSGIASKKHIKALGILSRIRGAPSRGKLVRLATAKLVALGYLHRKYSVYTPTVARAVRVFQKDYSLKQSGEITFSVWQVLAAATID